MQFKRLFVTIVVLFSLLLPSFAQAQKQERPIVRPIYFLPRDREPQPNIDEKMDQLIRDTQQFFQDQMEAHGFGRKTFTFETNAQGKAVVHHLKGQLNEMDYQKTMTMQKVFHEIYERFEIELTNYIYFVALDVSSERIGIPGVDGLGGGGNKVLIPASGPSFDVQTAAHELGHVFGLGHDFRDGSYIMSYGDFYGGKASDRLSKCAAEWLDVIPAFNASQSTGNEKETMEMLSLSLASPPNVIRIRFKVTDPDGIHQAQLRDGANNLINCKELEGTPSSIVEFVTTQLTPESTTVYLRTIDVHGNIGESGRFSINITQILPPPKVVSIPDANLAAAVRQEIGNISTHTMLNLTRLRVIGHQITDFTGLEHAVNLRVLELNSNAISDMSPLTGLTQLRSLHLGDNGITDVAPLAGLTQLRELYLWDNSITDVAPLAGLTQLIQLELSDNSITDMAPLAGLTQLEFLNLWSNNLTDTVPLIRLTQLRELGLGDNRIIDLSPLTGLTQLEFLNLDNNGISAVTPLNELTQLTVLSLQGNTISDVSPLVGLNLTGNDWESTGLNLYDNPLSYASINTHIPAMQAKGVKVKFDNVGHPALLKILGDAQERPPGTVLATPFVVEAMDAQGQPMQGVFVRFAITAGEGQLSATTAITDATGKSQTTLTLGRSPGKNTVTATASDITPSVLIFTAVAVGEPVQFTTDVNADGVVNIQDLVLVSSNLGQTGQNSADVNTDGVVNIQDLVLVAGDFGEGAAAAPALSPSALTKFSVRNIQQWLDKARRLGHTDVAYLRGIVVLEQLLVALVPKETTLLANYPNPFNPETWIPYQLAKSTEVMLRIYSVDGTLVRTLELGHQSTGMYHSKNRAAHWDGRNQHGEVVASGVYFYTLTAGNFTATRKMLIRK